MPPLVPSPMPFPPPPPSKYLHHAKCVDYWSDKHSRFHQLWGMEGWIVRHRWDTPCWGFDGWNYFTNAWNGVDCKRNWYTGNGGGLGEVDGGPSKNWVHPHFTKAAPALLGFDESIDWYCGSRNGKGNHAEACVEANVNILSLYGDRIPYNICRNVEWQLCAARGDLPGQGGKVMRFGFAPKFLEPDGGIHPIGQCEGYHPAGCGNIGYASSDIFYMEACLYSQVCKNRDEFWQLDATDDFVCEMDQAGFEQLRQWML